MSTIILPSLRHRLVSWKSFLAFLLGFGLLLLVLVLVLTPLGYRLAQRWAESPTGTATAGQALGRAMKVDGTLAPLHLHGWQVNSDSFTSTGWSGEAISSFDAHNIQLKLDPWSVFRGAWRVKDVQIAQAKINLRPPDDKLKRPVAPKKPRAWYAYLLPSRFECGPIVTPNANLEYTFRNQNAEITHAHLQADLIGKDFQYTVTSGTLTMPFFPPLRIEKLVLLVTHAALTIYQAELAGLDPADPAHLSLKGKMGMRADKSIHAEVSLTEMPLENILPPDLQPLLHGRATGHLLWSCDASGQHINSHGTLKLDQAGMRHLSFFRELSVLHNNPDLDDFTLDQADCDYLLEEDHLHLTLRAQANQKFSLLGTIDYGLNDKQAHLVLSFRDLILQTWLPQELKTGTVGAGSAEVTWNGILSSVKNSTGTMALHLDGAQIALPATFRQLLLAKGLSAPTSLQLQKAEMDFNYHDSTFFLKQGTLLAPNQVNAQMQGQLNATKDLQAQLNWHGFKMQNWLPPDLADQLQGDIDGDAAFSVQSWKLERGTYGGTVTLQHGQLRYTALQTSLARFLNERDLLDLPLNHATFAWLLKQGDLTLSDIDLRADGHFGVKGHLHVDAEKNLSGSLWIGLQPTYLKAFYGLGDDLFIRREDGLLWAQVQVSGTTKNPRQNLSQQLSAQLWKHPFAAFGLGAKLSSWYIGGLFGADKEWAKPKP